MLIKNVIVNNGIREYNSDEIKADKKIFQLVKSVIIWHKLEPLSDKINSENGLFYIDYDSDFSKGKGTLKNVSDKLMKECYG
tara:strand:+ start:638 stop:883 length:246 start_codon:yes stop_codon:yes gene_type:complete